MSSSDLQKSWCPTGWLLCILLLVDLAVGLAWLFAPTAHTEINPADIYPERGGAFITWPHLATPRGYVIETRGYSRLLLFEDGKPLGPALASHNDIRDAGGGAYSHWGRSLYFSSSDGSDPRLNGRRYSVETPLRLVPGLVPILFLCNVVVLAFFRPKRRTGRGVGCRVSGFAVACEQAWRMRWSLFDRYLSDLIKSEKNVVASSGSVTLLCLIFLPVSVAAVTWVQPKATVDSVVQMVMGFDDFSTPHYPPGYPMFTRFVANLTDTGTVLLSGQNDERVGWSMRQPPPYGLAGLRVVVWVQHALMIYASALLSLTLFKTVSARALSTAFLYLNPLTFTFLHSVLTEALVIPFTVLAVAFCARLFLLRNQKAWSALLFYVFSFLAGVTRFPAIIVVMLLPTMILMVATLEGIQERSLAVSLRWLKFLALTMVMTFITYSATSSFGRWHMESNNVEPRSIFGRAATHNLYDDAFRVIPGEAQERFDDTVRHLIERAPDNQTAQAIVEIARAEPWLESFNRVRDKVVRPNCEGCSRKEYLYRTDQMLNAVGLLTVFSGDENLARVRLSRLEQYLIGRQSVGATPCIQKPHSDELEERDFLNEITQSNSRVFKLSLTDLPALCSKVSNPQRSYAFLVVTPLTLLTLLFGWRQAHYRVCLAASLLVAGFGYATAMSVMTAYLFRYGVFVDLLVLMALLGLVSRFWVRDRSGVGS